MSDMNEHIKGELEQRVQAVPSLLQLTLRCISNLKPTWTFAQDLPEPAVPPLLEKIKHTDFDLDQLPNLLPASLTSLNLTGYHLLKESTVLAIIKKCFSLRTLILKDVPLLTECTLSKILWYLPNLKNLAMGAGVESLSILETERRPNTLEYLEINSAALDVSWLEYLRHFPHLTSLKLRNVSVPKTQSIAFKLPSNLEFVDITARCQSDKATDFNLLKFFLTQAPNLKLLIIGGSISATKEIGPIVAKDLRVLRGKRTVKVSQDVINAISDTCQQLQEVSGLRLIVSDTEDKEIGKVSVPAGESPVTFTYTDKKLNFDYRAITASTAWQEGPTELEVPSLASYVFPIDPCASLKVLKLNGGTMDFVEVLRLFPNLEVLALNYVTLKLNQQPKRVGHMLGYNLKSIDLRCEEVPAGAIDLLSKMPFLKRVKLSLDAIPEFKDQPVRLDDVLRRLPIVEHLTLTNYSTSITITNGAEAKSVNTALDHPLKELSLIGRRLVQLQNLDFNRYQRLQILHLHNLCIGANVMLHSRLRVLFASKIASVSSKDFSFPTTLYHLDWMSALCEQQLLQALPKMKNLCSMNINPYTRLRLGDRIREDKFRNYSRLKYLLPPRDESMNKTDYLSVVVPGMKDPDLIEKLKTKLDGTNLTIKELQLLIELYLKQEISIRSTEPIVHVKIRLTSGALLVIRCNPSHRVLDLYAYARHALKLGDKAFDLVLQPRTVLDLSTYDKTVQELGLANTTLIQKLRDFTPVENELRNVSFISVKLLDVGKSKPVVADENSMVDDNDDDDDVSMSESASNANESDDDEDDENSDSEENSMQISDDDWDWMSDMLPGPRNNLDEILAQNKYLIEQMNEASMRRSREYQEQKEREEREAFRAQQRVARLQSQSQGDFRSRVLTRLDLSQHVPRPNPIQPLNPVHPAAYNPQPIVQPLNWQQNHVLNGIVNNNEDLAGAMDDEEIAYLLQQDELLAADPLVPLM